MKAPALFVAGTDTGVGKTHVARALCRELRELGLDVAVFKPAETGCEDPSAPSDALALAAASGSAEPLDLICPYRLQEPLAPAVAAARQGVTIDLGRLDAALDQLAARHDVVICEGAGGLLVPLAERVLTVDWIERRRLPVLLVGRLGLGTINHVLLSARYLAQRSVRLVGTLLSACEPPPAPGLAEGTNPAVLSSYPEVNLLGVCPHEPEGRLPAGAAKAILNQLLNAPRSRLLNKQPACAPRKGRR
ncbi:MAG: dethiobiotin synthase [Deltaproteobacteria bacterium]|nr:dethiobiotin synthase [Deltaproteobacteria bacterium]